MGSRGEERRGERMVHGNFHDSFSSNYHGTSQTDCGGGSLPAEAREVKDKKGDNTSIKQGK